MTAIDARKQIQIAVGVTPDVNIGPVTLGAIAVAPTAQVEQVQITLHVAEDGIFGPQTSAALTLLRNTPDNDPWPGLPTPTNDTGVHAVIASDFADPSDLKAFQRCKSNGGSDQQCFLVGDNCIGKWQDSTAEGTGPCCALPPEEWAPLGAKAHLAKVLVTNPANGQKVVALLKDTMPHLANIKNGAGIDMNPDTCKALGLTLPVMAPVTWQWA